MPQGKSKSAPAVSITIRIPGVWRTPQSLSERLPSGYIFELNTLVMPDSTRIALRSVPPDNQFGHIFSISCRQLPTAKESRAIKNYTANILLTGPGGSPESAYKMMEAAGAVIDAGGAGVFIDNSALSHGGQAWKELVDAASLDSISFAFVTIVHGKSGLKTVGMHVLGLPDFELPSNDPFVEEERMISIIRYACSSDTPILPGHIITDEAGPKFHTVKSGRDEFHSQHPMFNPFGYLKLISTRDIGESN